MDEREMKRERVRRMIRFLPLILVGGTLFLALFGYLVMRLWNWLGPDLFGLPAIGIWQALGLLVLCRILFGGFGGGSGQRRAHSCRPRRGEPMTPEERERFKSGLRERLDAQPSADGS